MDIQSFPNPVNVKAGKDTEVKNHRLITLAIADESSHDSDVFAKILSSADRKDDLLEISESLIQPDERELPLLLDVLSGLAPVTYSATVPLSMIDSEQGNLGFDFNAQVHAHRGGDRPLNSLVSSIAPEIAAANALDARPMSVGADAVVAASSSLVETLNLNSATLVDAEQPLSRPVGTLANVTPVGINASQIERQRESTLPLLSTTYNGVPAGARAKSTSFFSPGKLTIASEKLFEFEINSWHLNAQSSLDEAGRKNEALLDVLAFGDGLSKKDGQPPTVNQVAYVFQRDPDSISTSISQSLAPNQTSLTDSHQAAEKSSYWLSNTMQNVALTLDGLGDQSVAVKISLSGIDTRIDIRTDHLALSQLIEDSVQTIKDQLSTEGLSLSELLVGTAGQDQGMAQSAGKENQSRENPGFLNPDESGHSPVVKKQISNQETSIPPKNDGRLSVFA